MRNTSSQRMAIGALLLVGLIGTGVAYANRVAIREWYTELMKEPIPAAVDITEFPVEPEPNEPAEPSPVKPNPTPVDPKPVVPSGQLPAEVNLAVPMVYQSPFANWDHTHQETCEEAAAMMVDKYLEGVKSLTRQEMEDQLLAIVDYEMKVFGYFEDTTAEETVQFMHDFLKVPNLKVVPTSVDEIKKRVAAGRPVIIPAAGKLLGNPNFRNGGPLYHMVVIKGYTKTGKFITNDPGTRLGADYLYDIDVLMTANHDWNGGDVVNGAKVMIVVE